MAANRDCGDRERPPLGWAGERLRLRLLPPPFPPPPPGEEEDDDDELDDELDDDDDDDGIFQCKATHRSAAGSAVSGAASDSFRTTIKETPAVGRLIAAAAARRL